MDLAGNFNSFCDNLVINTDIGQNYNTRFAPSFVSAGESAQYEGVLAYNVDDGYFYYSIDDGGGFPYTWIQLNGVT